MKPRTTRRLVTIAGGTGLLIALGILASRDVWNLTDPLEIYMAVSDAFFVPAVLLLCVGLLGLVSHEGFFDILSFAGRSVITLFTPFRKPENTQHYYEYKQARQARRGPAPGPAIFLVGLAFLAVAGVALGMYLLAGG